MAEKDRIQSFKCTKVFQIKSSMISMRFLTWIRYYDLHIIGDYFEKNVLYFNF
jgi:hypothetical protein